MNTLTETDKAYLAGLFDGEGCIIINKVVRKDGISPQYYLIAAVTSTNKDILDYCQELTSLGTVKVNTKEHGNTRTNYHWWMSCRDAEALLHALYPYLRIKKIEADTAFRFQKTVSSKGGNGVRLSPEILAERESCKRTLSKQKGYKSPTRGRPPIIRT
jgi:hypothetical protein